KTPRPPNAFILYRKDMHGELKKRYPDIHNNEISVLAGSLWKAERPEVRAKYYAKSVELKDQLLRAQPHYRYQPRRSADIRR
ncbi:high mobility group box domain-containing protein, partial [Schizothecium vesticola]